MRHLHLIAAIDCAGRSFLLVDAQHIAEISRSVAEDREVFAHALPEQAEHERLRQRTLNELRQTFGQRRFETAGLADRACTLARLPIGIAVGARKHQLVFSAAAFKTGFHRAISVLSRFAR